MKNTLLLLFALLLPSYAVFAQKPPRQVLFGRVIADTLRVENLSVLNVTSNIGAITDDKGEFSLYARPTDTLFFSSITFRSVYMVLKEKDFLSSPLVIKLDVNVTVLDEVIITPNPLSGDLEKDSKGTKTRVISSGFDSGGLIRSDLPRPTTRINNALPQTESQLTGVNFVQIFNQLFKKRKKTDKQLYLKEQSFTDAVKKRYTHHFFTETLKIPHEKIGLFLNFCDNGYETSLLLDPAKEFELTDYLIIKSAEFLKLNE